MKKLLITVVLMVAAMPAFGQYTTNLALITNAKDFKGDTDPVMQGRGSYFLSGLFGRRPDLQDCRAAIQGNTSPLEMVQLMGATRNGLDTFIDSHRNTSTYRR